MTDGLALYVQMVLDCTYSSRNANKENEMQTITRTAKSITLRNVLKDWKTTGMIEVGSVEAGTFDILCFDVVRPENGDKGWRVIDANKTFGPAMVTSLPAAKQYIADRVNEKAAA